MDEQNLLPIESRYIEAAKWIMSQMVDGPVPEAEIQYLAARAYVTETVEVRAAKNADVNRSGVRNYLKRVGIYAAGRDFSEDEYLVDILCEVLVIIQYKVAMCLDVISSTLWKPAQEA